MNAGSARPSSSDARASGLIVMESWHDRRETIAPWIPNELSGWREKVEREAQKPEQLNKQLGPL